MRKVLGFLFVFLLAPTLPAQAQFGDLLKKLEQEANKTKEQLSRPNTAPEGQTTSGPSRSSPGASNNTPAEPAGKVPTGNLTETLGKELSRFILAVCAQTYRKTGGSDQVDEDFYTLISDESLDSARVLAVIGKDRCVKVLGDNMEPFSGWQEARVLQSKYQEVTGAKLDNSSFRPLFTSFLNKLGSTDSSEFRLFSSELAAYADYGPYRKFLAKRQKQQERNIEEARLDAEAKAVADKALGGDFSGVESCSELTDNRQFFNPKWRQAKFFGGSGKIDIDEQPTLEPTNGLRAHVATFVRYDPPIGFLMTKTNPIKFIAPKGKGKVWFNKERTKLNSNLLLIGKYVKNEKVRMTNGQEVVVPVLEAWCIEQVD